MATSTTASADTILSSVIDELVKKLNIEPDEFVDGLVDRLSKKLVDKIARVSSSQPIKQRTQEQKEPQEKPDQLSLDPLLKTLTSVSDVIKNVNAYFKKQDSLNKSADIEPQEVQATKDKTPLEKMFSTVFPSFNRALDKIDGLFVTKEDKQNQIKDSSIADKKKESNSLLEAKNEPTPVLFAGFTYRGRKELLDILPEIFSKIKVAKLLQENGKPAASTSSPMLGGFSLGPGIIKGALATIATIGGLFTILYGLQTEGPFKGLSKLVGRIVLSMSGFTNRVQKVFVSLVEHLITVPKKLLKLFAKGIGVAFGEGAAKSVFKTGLTMLKGFFPKLFGSFFKLLKRIPLIGSLISLGFAISRFNSGDYLGGGLEVLAGLLNLIPPPFGTILSLAVDGLNAFLDFKSDGIGGDKNKVKSDMFWGALKSIGTWIGEKLYDMPIIGNAIKSVQAFIDGNWKEGFEQLALTTPVGWLIKGVISLFDTPPIESQSNAGSSINFKNPFVAFQDAIVAKAKAWWKSLAGWIKAFIPAEILAGLDETPPTIEPQTNIPGVPKNQPAASRIEATPASGSTPVQNVEPASADNVKPERQQTATTITNNTKKDNLYLKLLVENTNDTNKQLSGLKNGFTVLAKALEKLGVSIASDTDPQAPSTYLVQPTQTFKRNVAESINVTAASDITVLRRAAELSRIDALPA